MDGRVVSHYRITDRLDGGGMGVIYAAEDTHLKRTVVLKFLAPELTRDREARDRFMQEAEAASALDHPNICTIYDVDTAADGQLFIAMVYYDGETLKTRLARGPLAVADALEIAAHVACGLEKAHQAGIVHRDIKPANLMITRDGLVKILDFGVAKLRDRTSLTRTGVTLGTISYMAPEQVRGGGADARADLWSLGVVLYEMLTGRSPFAADRDLIVIHNILNVTPTPAARLRPDVPADVAAAIDRLMAKDPGQRYQTAADVLQALTPHAPAASSSLGRIMVAAAIVALMAAAGTVAWFVKRASDERRVDTLIAEATRLADADDDISALPSLEAIERIAPKDARLQRLWDRTAIHRPIVTVPDGVDVYVKPYAKPAAPWQHLGRTPLRDVRVARGAVPLEAREGGIRAD